MFTPRHLQKPFSLITGQRYILLTKNEQQILYEDVFFSSYTSSPEAVVIITTSENKLRVSRNALYEEYDDQTNERE